MSTSEPGASTTTPPPGYREGLASNGGEQSTKDQAQEKAQQAAGQAKEQAQQVAGQAKSRARTVVDDRSTQAGQQVNQQAGDLRTVGQKLREEGKEGPAKIADQAADRGEKLGRYLEQSDADRILSDIEDLGRRQPWAVALGGLALGFAASRFLKASSSQRYQSRSSYGSSYGTRPGYPAPNRPALPRTSEQPSTGIGATGAPAGRPTLSPEPPRTPEPPLPPTPGRTGL
jgi:gas vesicle protein